jgi:hypothetical protein
MSAKGKSLIICCPLEWKCITGRPCFNKRG